ncbi:MAG: alcohol dehydrogenase catalytic domain-containing protein [Dehalococcoidia bacterium]|nr:alcohol dehydrogenase catalytic domain-containing protein [Dehalococcoidia bacterium]
MLVWVKEVGLDGTYLGIVSHGWLNIAEGYNEIVLGHEKAGVVRAVGTGVTKLVAGDTVTITAWQGCGICQPCLHNRSDMCKTVLFIERGTHKKDGFLTQFVVGREQYMVKVPVG